MYIVYIKIKYLQFHSLKIIVVLSTNTKLSLCFYRVKTKKRITLNYEKTYDNKKLNIKIKIIEKLIFFIKIFAE